MAGLKRRGESEIPEFGEVVTGETNEYRTTRIGVVDEPEIIKIERK